MRARSACLTLLVPALAAALAGCTGSGPTVSRSLEPSPSSSPAPTVTTAAPSPSPTAVPAATPTTRPTPQDPLSPQPPVESPAPVGQPTCRAGALTVTDADAVITSSAIQELFVIRTSGAACQLEGWPTVQLRNATGPLPLTVRHGGFGLPAERPQPVTLTRDTSLSFSVAGPRSGSCRTATQLVVTLPGTSTALRAGTSMSVCGSQIGVSPVRRNTDQETASE